MASNRNHGVAVSNLEVVKVTHRRIYLRGSCGETLFLRVDDWSQLRTRIERAARIARKQKPSPMEEYIKSLNMTYTAARLDNDKIWVENPELVKPSEQD